MRNREKYFLDFVEKIFVVLCSYFAADKLLEVTAQGSETAPNINASQKARRKLSHSKMTETLKKNSRLLQRKLCKVFFTLCHHFLNLKSVCAAVSFDAQWLPIVSWCRPAESVREVSDLLDISLLGITFAKIE